MTDLAKLSNNELLFEYRVQPSTRLMPYTTELRLRFAALTARITELEAGQEQRCIAHAAVAVLNGDCPICDVEVAEAERDALKEALRKYGDHDPFCRSRSGRLCNCGLDSALSSPVAGEDPGDLTDGLPPEVTRVLRDQSIIVSRDAEVFEKIAEWQKAPSHTASADLPAPAEEEGT